MENLKRSKGPKKKKKKKEKFTIAKKLEHEIQQFGKVDVKHYIMEKMEFSSNIMTGTMNSVFVEFEWIFRLWISYILVKGTAVENNLLLIRITWDGRSIDWGNIFVQLVPLHPCFDPQKWEVSFPWLSFYGNE
jgi:hypothetical protein